MPMVTDSLVKLAEKLVSALQEKHLTITTAESCTGGLIAGTITSAAGASQVFNQGYITYANAAKIDMLHVGEQTLADCGAVCAEVAIEMAEGAREEADADIAISATGIAGPGGATEGKPVGLIYIGIATPERSFATEFNFKGSRSDIRNHTIEAALTLALEQI